MTSSENAEINEAIDRAFVAMGGAGTNAQVVAELWPTLPDHLRSFLSHQGLRTKVSNYFRRKNSAGFASAPEVSKDGTHVQFELLTADQFRYVVAGHVSAGGNEFRIAKQYALEAKARLGVDIDLRNPLGREQQKAG